MSGPSHGYQLIRAIEEKTGGAYVPSPGVMYPTLSMLEDLGYILAGENDDNRKLYKISAAGRKFLTENKAVLESINARLSDTAAARGAGVAPQIIRAMHNLKMAPAVARSRAAAEHGADSCHRRAAGCSGGGYRAQLNQAARVAREILAPPDSMTNGAGCGTRGVDTSSKAGAASRGKII